MTKKYWAVAFTERPDSYIWIGWDRSVNEARLPYQLSFRMMLFNTRGAARLWVKERNESLRHWHSKNMFCVKRVQITVAPPPRINGKLVRP